MPGTNDALAAQRAFRERSAVVRADCANRIIFSMDARQQYVRPAGVDLFHLTVMEFGSAGDRNFFMLHENSSFAWNHSISSRRPIFSFLARTYFVAAAAGGVSSGARAPTSILLNPNIPGSNDPTRARPEPVPGRAARHRSSRESSAD